MLGRSRNIMKGKIILKKVGIVILCIALLVAAVLIFYTVREYRPKSIEFLNTGNGTKTLSEGDSFSVLTYNTGYGALSKDEDFFMDGGRKVQPDRKEVVETNLAGISDILKNQAADFYFLQEVDIDAKRSFHINERAYYEKALDMSSIYACNFKCDFVPYPVPPIGKVEAGLVTMTDYQVESAKRIKLAESFSWPIKTCNLKRCMLETRIPIEGTDKELVLINFHLEAYDSGEGKIIQSRMLSDKLQEEYKAGNYVIAGGDFNQQFEGVDTYEIHDTDSWVPGTVYKKDLPEGFDFAVADNAPTCRLLNGPYSGNYEDSQVYVIDGYIVSDNLQVEQVNVVDTDFEYTDHQPVSLRVTLQRM